jgi:hypothetical protein
MVPGFHVSTSVETQNTRRFTTGAWDTVLGKDLLREKYL